MTKKQLQQHRALKREIEELDKKILQEQKKEISVTQEKVKASMKDFPYIEIYNAEQAYISKKLINEYQKRKLKAEKETLEIETFISSISDAEIRLMFQYSFIDGMKQREIAERLHMERSNISKKITEILQLSQKSVLY
ncbi:MAG: sigma-70 family RNA polymerase sigma factor [Lachnospiraceae bacterium]|nr:sigma-70 family RNA polymerase sigma factor [Lachnospiraceae bacterium]